MAAQHVIAFDPTVCVAAEDIRPVVLGGEKAEMRAFHCPYDGPNAVVVDILTIHKVEGWVATCAGQEQPGDQITSLEEKCTGWLSTFHFLS